MQREADIESLVEGLSAETHAAAVKLASLREEIGGFSYVKRAATELANAEREQILKEIDPGASCAAALCRTGCVG